MKTYKKTKKGINVRRSLSVSNKISTAGITLISLAITIVVLLILTGITISSGKSVIQNTKFNAFSAELKIMQTNVNDLYDKYKSGESINGFTGEDILTLIGKDITSDSTISTQANKVFASRSEDGSGITDKTGYRFYDVEALEQLGIEGVKNEYFVNILKRSVISYEGFEYNGEIYYTVEQLPNSLYNVEYKENSNIPTFDVSVENVEDGKWKVTISNIYYEGYINKWQTKYKLEGNENWETSDSTEFFVNQEGNYKVKIENGDIVSDEFGVIVEVEKVLDVSGANHPVLKTGMEAIILDSAGRETVVTDSDGRDWYNYVEQTAATDTYNEETGEYGTSHWANAKLNGNYYVWIPRYAYKIYDDPTEEGYVQYTSQSGTSYRIDVKFIGTGVTSSNVETQVGTGYIVHPAFTFGGQELSGIWVGKYHATGTSASPTILPNEIAITETVAATMFDTAKKLVTDEQKEEIDAHMLKNIEWGAISYLAQSQYGRNGTEVSVNQCENYVTGAGRGIGTETDSPIYNSSYTQANITVEQQYNGIIGKLSSTTGNVYGVYDMSGGAREYVMGFYGTAENKPSFAASGFTTTPDRKYYDLYINKTSPDSSNIGDALFETQGWNDDATYFVTSNAPMFVRGGSTWNTKEAGIFNYYFSSNSSILITGGFRVCLVVE